jgi:hypothetical protein
MVTKLIVILTLAAGTAATYALQQRQADDALPCVEGIEIPQIVVTAKREHGAE